MDFANLPGFIISPKSEKAKAYFKNHHIPAFKDFDKKISEQELSIALCFPMTFSQSSFLDILHYAFKKILVLLGLEEMAVPIKLKRQYLSAETKYGKLKKDLKVILQLIPKIPANVPDDIRQKKEDKQRSAYSAVINQLNNSTRQHNLAFICVEHDAHLLETLINFCAKNQLKYILLTNPDTLEQYNAQTGTNADHHQEVVLMFSDFTGTQCINHLKAIRLLLHLQANNMDLGRKGTINNLYERYRNEIEIYFNSGMMSLLSFIRYMAQAESADFQSHFFIDDNDLNRSLTLLTDNKFLKLITDNQQTAENFGKYTLTPIGSQLFPLFELSKLTTIVQEDAANKARMFLERWRFPISATYNATTKVFNDQAEIQKLFEKKYLAVRRQYSFLMFFKQKWKKIFGIAVPKAGQDKTGDTKTGQDKTEKDFWDYETIKFLFKIWKENIAGYKSGFRAEERERAEFLAYVKQRLRIYYEPEHREKYQRFKDLAFGLKMNRANNQAHIYITFPFTIRAMKDFAEQYLNLAIITGEYELLLKRYPPYNHLLNLYSGAGDRTFMDSRRFLDITLFTYRLDFNFVSALNLHNVQSRRKECYITCPMIIDEEAEAIKEAEINNLQNALSGIFKSPAYLGDVNFDEEGNVVLRDNKTGENEIVGAYGPRRVNYIQTRDYLTLLKANQRPAPNSGLIIRFNLMEPVAALLTGMNENRPIPLEQLINLWKCMELFQGKDIKELDEITQNVFLDQYPRGLKQGTIGLLKMIEKIKEEKGEAEAWNAVIPKLLQGINKPLVQTLCHSMIGDGFEFVFSLLPLLTGLEVKYDLKTGIIETYENPEHGETKAANKPGTGVVSKKKNTIPLLSILQQELEILLTLIFSKHLDISGGTAFCRSEQIIAGEIVRYCLETREEHHTKHQERLKELLLAHYNIYNRFLEEYSAQTTTKQASVIYMIDKLTIEPTERCENDLQQIEQLIQKTRNNLTSRGKNNRLLRYIDQASIDIKIGDFEYSGRIIDEINFIKADVKLQVELGELSKQRKTKIRKEIIEKRSEGVVLAFKSKNELDVNKILMGAKRETMEREMKALELKEKKQILELESQRRILKMQILTSSTEIEASALENIKLGDLKGLALCSLLRTCEIQGVNALESILDKSPKLIMAVNNDMYQEIDSNEMKESIMGVIKENKDKIGPVAMSLFLDRSPAEIVQSDVFKEMIDKFSKALEARTFQAHTRQPGQNMKVLTDLNTQSSDKNKDQDIEDQLDTDDKDDKDDTE